MNVAGIVLGRPRESEWDRIVGGKNTTIDQVPYQVSVQVDGYHYCGGTIISKNWILTAAHCAQYPIQSYTLRIGTDRLQVGGHLHKVSRIIIHEEHLNSYLGTQTHDIALFRVKESFLFDKSSQPIKLYNRTTNSKDTSTISGWGITDEGKFAEQLQIVHVPVISKNNCSKAYKKLGGIREGQICAAHPQGGKDSCSSDSGGPMTINGYLAGIISWGKGCGLIDYPGVYTEVLFYRRWILHHLDESIEWME